MQKHKCKQNSLSLTCLCLNVFFHNDFEQEEYGALHFSEQLFLATNYHYTNILVMNLF